MTNIESGASEQAVSVNNTAHLVANQALDAAIDVLEDIQKVITMGKPKSLRIKLGDKTIAEVPLAVTAAAAFAAGLGAILLTKLAVEVVTED